MLDAIDRSAHLLERRRRDVPRGVLTAHPLVLARAQGTEVWDVNDGATWTSSAASAC
jgi:4-aminobutyrate aminotransferase/(S)-3-amino-2-methylpropionate transaminase